jgi:hypothetical protein
VVPGPPVAEAWTPMANLWSAVAARVAAWPGTVITDLGRLQPGHPGLVLAEAADVVLLLTTGTVDGLFHARERARELGAVLERDVARSRVAVVVRAGGKDKAALGEVSRVLKDLVPVVGGFADDPGGVQALLGGSDTAVLRGSALVRSGEDLVARIHRLLPPVEGPSGSVSPARSSASLRLLRRVL